MEWQRCSAKVPPNVRRACFYAEQCRLCVRVLCLACSGPALEEALGL